MVSQPGSYAKKRWQRYGGLALLLGLPLLLLLPGIQGFPYPPRGDFSDLAIAHYPNAVFLRSELFSGRGIPLWSPLILSGTPLGANPLSGLWYPPGWLALFWPLPFGLNLLVFLHLWWGGLGVYCLLRDEGLDPAAALWGGLAFTALPKLLAHYGAGHLTLLYAVPWTPWLLLVTRRSLAGERSTWLLPGALLGLIFLADPRWAALAGAAWLGYWLANARRFAAGWGRQVGWLAAQGGLAALLAAPLALPLLEYTRLSTRAHLSAADVLTLSLEPARLLGLFYPDFGGAHEFSIYTGLCVFLGAMLALTWGRVRRRAGYWGWLALLSLLFSLGASLPLTDWLVRLPGLSLLRVPARALFLNGLALVVLAAYALQALLVGLDSAERRRGGLLLVGVAAFSTALGVGVQVVNGSLLVGFAWGSAAALLVAAWGGLGLSGRLPRPVWLTGWCLLTLVDLGVVDHSLFIYRPVEQVMAEGGQAAAYLSARAGPFRVYSPSYSLPQQTAVAWGLELADGVDPLQLQAYADFMDTASGVPRSGYSVTLPPLASGEPALDNKAFRPVPARLGLLNIGYVAAAYDLSVPGLIERARFGDMRLYENLQVLPRLWVQPVEAPVGEQIRPAQLEVRTSGRWQVRAAGPGLLIFSEVFYPGWQARLDGQPARLQPVAGLLRGIVLPPGEHQVEMIFLPLSVYLGWCLGLLGLTIYGGSRLLTV